MNTGIKTHNNNIRIIISLIASVICVIGINTNIYRIAAPTEYSIENIVSSIEINSFNAVMAIVGSFFLSYVALCTIDHNMITIGFRRVSIAISAFYSIMIPIGKAYRYDNSLSLLTLNKSQIVKTFMLTIGWMILLLEAVIIVFRIMRYFYGSNDRKVAAALDYTNNVFSFLKNKSYLIVIIMVLRYIPIYILYFPGILMGDTGNQIPEAFGYMINWSGLQRVYQDSTYTNMHPILHTLMYKWFMNFGKWVFGSYTAGLFIMLLVQSLLLIAVVSGVFIYFLKKSGSPGIVAIVWICLMANPIVTNYMLLATKDVLYTVFLTLFIFELYLSIRDEKSMSLILFIISTIGTIVFRGEGFFIVIISLVIESIYLISKKMHSRKIIITGILSIIFYFALNSVVLPVCHIEQQSSNEHMCIPMQQIARYVCNDYPFTEKEKDIIDNVMDYDSISEKYNPTAADSVKNLYKTGVTNDQKKEFIGLWLRTGIKHPSTALSAYLDNKYAFFTLDEPCIWLYDLDWSSSRMDGINAACKEIDIDLNLRYPESLADLRREHFTIMKVCSRMPLVDCFCCSAVYTLIMIMLFSFYLLQKDKAGILTMIPVILVFIIPNLFGAVNGSYSRYMYPIVVALTLEVLIFTAKER